MSRFWKSQYSNRTITAIYKLGMRLSKLEKAHSKLEKEHSKLAKELSKLAKELSRLDKALSKLGIRRFWLDMGPVSYTHLAHCGVKRE